MGSGLRGFRGRALFFSPAVVHSWVLVAPWDAILAKVGGVFPEVVWVLAFAARLLLGIGDLARVLALFSICLVAVSR